MKRSFALLLSMATLALGQNPPNPSRIPGLPTGSDTEDSPNGIVQSSGDVGGEIDPDAIAIPAGQSLQYPKANGIEIAELIWNHSRKRVILSKAASETEIFFVQRGPMTHREVMKFLKASLLIEGLAMIEDQLDPNIVRLLPAAPVASVQESALPYIESPLGLPETDQLVTYRMQFRALKPEDALSTFQSVVSLGADGKMVAVANASSLIITANTSIIRQLIKIKDDIDKGALTEQRWVKIVYADVDEISEQLNTIYGQQGGGSTRSRGTSNRRTTGSPTPPGLPGGGGANANRGGASGGAGEEIPINIIPDTRTSRLLIIGRPSDLDSVEQLIRSYDVPSDPRTDFRYQLRYLRVGDFIPIASQAIERTLGSSAQGGGGGRAAGRNGGQNRNQNNRNQGNRNQNRNQNRGGGGGGGGGNASIQAQDVPTEPTAEIVGKTLLVADNVSNSVIVQGPPHHIEVVKNLIAELDTASQQVVISAVIGSYALGKDLNFGVDLARTLRGNGRFQLAGRSAFGGPGRVIGAADLDNLSNFLSAAGAAGSGVSLYGQLNDNFGVFVNALESNNKFKVLQRPVITTRNNRVATITSGQRIAVPASSFTGGGAAGTTTNVEFRDVVLELEVQPLINSDNEITLEISLVRDSIVGTNTIGENDIPIIGSDSLSSSVTIPNGAALILGGLITEENEKNKSGVPVLSRIPGLGRLFSNNTNRKDRQELVILLRPEIISGSSDLGNFQRSFEHDASIARDARLSLPRTASGMLPPSGVITEAPKRSAKSSINLKTSRPVKKDSWLKPPASKAKKASKKKKSLFSSPKKKRRGLRRRR